MFECRNVPAALYKCLGGFATNGVNMTKLESYMVGGTFSATVFFAEVEGHPSDAALSRALEELDYFSREVRIMGVYPADPLPTRRGRQPTLSDARCRRPGFPEPSRDDRAERRCNVPSHGP